MCGRFTLSNPAEVVAELFELAEIPNLVPRYNITPTQPVLVVRSSAEDSARQAYTLRWGLIPYWADDPKIGARMINARAETVSTKPAFRSAFRRRRCLVIADGFYEWQKLQGRKQPHFIHLGDRRPFAFAGLWEHWEGPGPPETDLIDSCTIITSEPNELITPLHNRMPVILRPNDYATWLSPDPTPTDALEALLRPYPATEMAAYPVSTRVNNPSNDSPECVRPHTT